MGKSERAIKKLVSLLAKKNKTSGYDTQATVRRIEGSTAWVHIPGGVDETPVKLTIDAKAGDSVQVRVSGGKAFLVGNSTAPPTDDTKAKEADSKALKANRLAQVAQKAADDARKTATNYLSWTAEDGLIVSEDATEDPSEMTGGSTRITSAGVNIYKGQNKVAEFGEDITLNRAEMTGDGTLRVLMPSDDRAILETQYETDAGGILWPSVKMSAYDSNNSTASASGSVILSTLGIVYNDIDGIAHAVGQIDSNTGVSVTCSSSMTYYKGATLTLYKGIYLVTANAGFASVDSSAGCTGIAIHNGTDYEATSIARAYQAQSYWSAMNTSCVIRVTEIDTEVSVRVLTNRTGRTVDTSISATFIGYRYTP